MCNFKIDLAPLHQSSSFSVYRCNERYLPREDCIIFVDIETVQREASSINYL